jgi:molybdopterin synthase sulfur carrier subunit
VNVRVLLFASLREAAGMGELSLTLDSDSRSGAVLTELARRMPERSGLLERCALAVNEEYTSTDLSLHDGDIVAVIPPVSGG